MNEPVDIVISHDWPRSIAHSGDLQSLLRTKPNFREDIESNRLGSPGSELILKRIQPTYWFSAHMHVKFEATCKHESGKVTKFLALDKCLPNRKYLEVNIEFTSISD